MEIPVESTKKHEAAIPWDGQPIPVELWYDDHLSTLLYYETRYVDGLDIDPRKMRRANDKYPTRLRDGSQLSLHGDLECLLDAEAAGFGVTTRRFSLTLSDLGWAFVSEVRRQRGNGTALKDINAAEVLKTAQRVVAALATKETE